MPLIHSQIFIPVPFSGATNRRPSAKPYPSREREKKKKETLTVTSIEAVILPRNLHSRLSVIDHPVLRAGAITVVDVDRRPVRVVRGLDVEAFGGVAVGVDGDGAAGRGRVGAAAGGEVPGAVERPTRSLVCSVRAGVRESIVHPGGEVETTVRTTGALKQG